MATPKWYANGILHIENGDVDLVADTIKLKLVTSSYTPDQSAHNYDDDTGANEASGGSGYTAGGFTLANKTVTVSTLTVNFDADNISQAIVGGPFAFRYGVFYKDRGGAASADELVGYVDFGAQSVTDATINITLTNQLTVTVS
jgi:phage baseplate assembly protein gpV